MPQVDIVFYFDELIDAQTKKLESLKAHKKGLMQQLFPNSTTESTP
jgi:type I restriction enzyme S subunit